MVLTARPAPLRTRRIRPRSLAAAGTALVALVGAGTAHAATYCVADPACVTAGGMAEPTVDAGLAAAHATPEADVVRIGAGTFQGNFGTNTPTSPVEIVGAGRGKTILTALASGKPSYAKVLSLQASSAKPVVARDFTVKLSGDSARGIDMTSGAIARRVDVEASGATNAIGVASSGSTYEGGNITLAGSSNEGTSIDGAAVVRDARIEGGIGVFAASSGAEMLIQRTVLTTTGTGVHFAGGTLRLEDSLIDGRAATAGRLVNVGSTNAPVPTWHLTMANDTVVGDPSHAGTYGLAVWTSQAAGHPSVSVVDTVFSGFAKTAMRYASAGSADIAYDHSAHGGADDLNTATGGGSIVETAGLGDPAVVGFADATAGDFRLTAASPLVDAGTPGSLGSADGPLDLASLQRVVDGDRDGVATRDVGAYEFAPPAVLGDPPVAPAVDGAGAGAGGSTMPGTPPVKGMPGTPPPGYVPPSEDPQADRLAPRLSKLAVVSVTVGRAKTRRPALRFTADEAATLGIVLERRVGKRWTRVKGSLTLRGAAGLNTIALPSKIGRTRLVAGRYRLTLVARDAASNVTAPAVVGFVTHERWWRRPT